MGNGQLRVDRAGQTVNISYNYDPDSPTPVVFSQQEDQLRGDINANQSDKWYMACLRGDDRPYAYFRNESDANLYVMRKFGGKGVVKHAFEKTMQPPKKKVVDALRGPDLKKSEL